MRDVSVTGVGSTRFGRHDGEAVDELAADAARDTDDARQGESP